MPCTPQCALRRSTNLRPLTALAQLHRPSLAKRRTMVHLQLLLQQMLLLLLQLLLLPQLLMRLLPQLL